jgi:hypothetical protein
MAESGSLPLVGNSILVDNMCGKCSKVVRNGILRDNCDKWYHFNKCSNLNEDKIADNQWLSATCSLRNIPVDENTTTHCADSEL